MKNSGGRCEGCPCPGRRPDRRGGFSLVHMSPYPNTSVTVRPASVVNEEIRDLWQRSGGLLSPDEETRYQRLLVEWATASGTSVRPAA